MHRAGSVVALGTAKLGLGELVKVPRITQYDGTESGFMLEFTGEKGEAAVLLLEDRKDPAGSESAANVMHVQSAAVVSRDKAEPARGVGAAPADDEDAAVKRLKSVDRAIIEGDLPILFAALVFFERRADDAFAAL